MIRLLFKENFLLLISLPFFKKCWLLASVIFLVLKFLEFCLIFKTSIFYDTVKDIIRFKQKLYNAIYILLFFGLCNLFIFSKIYFYYFTILFVITLSILLNQIDLLKNKKITVIEFDVFLELLYCDTLFDAIEQLVLYYKDKIKLERNLGINFYIFLISFLRLPCVLVFYFAYVFVSLSLNKVPLAQKVKLLAIWFIFNFILGFSKLIIKWLLKLLLRCIADKDSLSPNHYFFFHIIEEDIENMIAKLLDVQLKLCINNKLQIKIKCQKL